MINHIKSSLIEASKGLSRLIQNDETHNKIAKAGQLQIKALTQGGKIFSCGNGGSMCDAMHFAEELTGCFRNKRKGIAAVAISDPGHISCVSNDFGYEYIFSRYIESHGKKDDVLVAMSTSGSSENVMEAVRVSNKMGISTIVLTGQENSLVEGIADVCICTPAGSYADRVQELHIKVLHIFIELIERELYSENYN